MVFTLFKKKRSESCSPAVSPISGPSSPSLQASSSSSSLTNRGRYNSNPSSPALQASDFGAPPAPAAPAPDMIKLRVLVDPLVLDKTQLLLGVAKDIFYINVHPEDPVDIIKQMVEDELDCKRTHSVGCYKVHIPWAAHFQSKSYTQRYSVPVNLISHFPACNLDDPAQIAHSLQQHDPLDRPQGIRHSGSRSKQMSARTVGDWWPDGVDNKEGVISVLVRLGELDTRNVAPLTLLAHFNIPRVVRPSRSPESPSPSGASSTDIPCPPTAVDISRDCTVLQLKERLMKADGRQAGSLEKVVLWRVDMTWKEMLDCESFGGLRDGGMPWPYPPNASAPTHMNNDNALLSSIFTKASDPNLVSIYAWIPPCIEKLLAKTIQTTSDSNPSESIPNFCYPMLSRRHGTPTAREGRKLHESPIMESPRSRSTSRDRNDTNSISKSLNPRSRPSRRGGSSRPSTAPAAISSSGSPGTTSIPVFGHKSTVKRSPSARDQMCSPLSSSPITASKLAAADGFGLGIGGVQVEQRRTPLSSSIVPAASPRISSKPSLISVQISPPTPRLSNSSESSSDSRSSADTFHLSETTSHNSCFESTGTMGSDVDADLVELLEPKSEEQELHELFGTKARDVVYTSERDIKRAAGQHGGSAAMKALRQGTLKVSYRT